MENKTVILNSDKYNQNPRAITENQAKLLKEHIEELGDLSGVIYCHNNKAFVGGNQRSDIFNGAEIQIVERFDPPTKNKTVALGYIQYKGEKFSYREVLFTEKEFKKACIVANNDGGSFDWDIMEVNFDKGLLLDWGMDLPKYFGAVEGDNSIYTDKIKSPIYTPGEKKPAYSELLDKSKSDAMIKKIQESDIPKKDKEFLMLAAGRHIVFNYDKIADYYAHSEKSVQKLIEDSALVIIDFKRAIELGYVKLSQEISEQYEKDTDEE